MGNICRSPLAEIILQDKLGKNYTVESAGTINFHEGKPADKRSIMTAEKYGLDLTQHRARQIKPKDFEIYDRIYCMDEDNYRNAEKLASTDKHREKLHMMLDVLDEDIKEVPDPYWGEMKDFDYVYHLLDRASEKIKQELQKTQ